MGYTVFTPNTAPTSNTDANFRAWGKWISDAIANSGMTLVANNADWATVSKPTGTAVFPMTEIWAFADGAQATAPIVFKLEYGASAWSVNLPAIAVTIGKGYVNNIPFSFANGSLQGPVTQRRVWQTAIEYVNATMLSYACGDTNRFALAFAANGVNANSPSAAGSTRCHIKFGIERTLDANGAVTSEGALLCGGSYLSFEQVAWSRNVGQWTNWDTGSWGFFTPELSGSLGSDKATYPHYFHRGQFLPPALNFMGYCNPDFTANTTNVVTIYGTSHTYMPLGYAAFNNFGSRLGTNCCAMIRWE